MANTDILRFFSAVIEREMGIVYQEANYFQLEHRLEGIAKQLNLDGVLGLYEASKNGLSSEVREMLLDVATNNETSFFRDPAVFRALSEKIFPELANKMIHEGNNAEINVWSAACSSGQEALSVAMQFDDFKRGQPKVSGIDLKFFLTDISQRILNRAKGGEYSQIEIQRGLSDQQIQAYFNVIEGGLWRVKDFLHRGFQFQRLNLLDSFYGLGPFDLVFCRNVLIYQEVENKKNILKKISEVMRPKGFLFLGAAESMIGLSDDFIQENFEGAVVFRKK